jgi:hypothetical protein
LIHRDNIYVGSLKDNMYVHWGTIYISAQRGPIYVGYLKELLSINMLTD